MAETRTRKIKKKWGKVWESTVIERAAVIDDDKAEEIANYIEHTDVITPQQLANKHGIRVSLARDILTKFAEEGSLSLEFKNGTTEIYSR